MELRRSSALRVLLGFLVLSLIASSSLGRFVVEKNSLMVTSPDKIKGKHDSAIGNFGIPQYGGSMAGTVVYPKENQKGCKSFDGFGISFQAKSGSLPTFVLVDRGDCFFALKVWNAQNAGASAVLVADDIDEALITMDSPEADGSSVKYIENITIPSAFIEKGFGETLKKAVTSGEMVNVNLDWREAVPHPDDRVEYELWTNSNDECGVKCDMLMEFVKDFKGAAQILEKGGYTQFTPHYITWYCPQAFTLSRQCKSQCINHGRYCAPDPEQDFSSGYDGKDVVQENLRQLCVFRVANETNKPWLWWDYVTDFQIRCPMKDKKYNKECADGVIKSLGLDIKKIDNCMGDPHADSENPVLKEEQDAQVGKGSRGDVTILPTLVVNNRQYRGKLEKSAVLKAICSGFEETTEPAVCLSDDVETNECLDNNGGCWLDKAANLTACKDTFRGRVCECPLVDGVQFKGDGYTKCEASGPGRCKINNGGCWHDSQDGHSFSACSDNGKLECQCPTGFKGDGVKSCEGDKSLFKTLKEKVGDYVKFGDGSHAQVLSKGTVEILGLPLLKDVIYIKGLKANLLSITQICDEDFLVQFSKKGCLIINEEGIQVLEGNRTTDNCYEVVPIAPISCRSARVNMLEFWHHRFGHANFKQVAKVSKLEAVEGLPKFRKVEKTICEACQMGKQTKASHHKVNVIATSRCLELFHV